ADGVHLLRGVPADDTGVVPVDERSDARAADVRDQRVLHPRPVLLDAGVVARVLPDPPASHGCRVRVQRRARFIAFLGPLVAGSIIAALGGYGTAATVVGLVYILGMLVVPFCPETKGKALPE